MSSYGGHPQLFYPPLFGSNTEGRVDRWTHAIDLQMDGGDDTSGQTPPPSLPPPPPPPPIDTTRNVDSLPPFHFASVNAGLSSDHAIARPVSQGSGPHAPGEATVRDGEHDGDSDEDDESERGIDPEDVVLLEDGSQWKSIEEDTTTPHPDEIAWITKQGEYDALDHAHWEKEAFFDLDDPELFPIESGRIEWVIERFNGSKEQPNKNLVMTSEAKVIGGHSWKIKLYPRGNDSRHLSVYVEIVDLQDPDVKDEEMLKPPLPVAMGSPVLLKRRSVAAQISVVMYNPAEPRTTEFQTEAHQFHKGHPDYGWKYFTSEQRANFHKRRHGQRQAILRNDSLAFTAYIRVIHDPTGCLWEHTTYTSPWDSVAITGLRPFAMSAEMCLRVLLFHLKPWRIFTYKNTERQTGDRGLKAPLLKMLSRQMSSGSLRPASRASSKDFVEQLAALRSNLEGGNSDEMAIAKQMLHCTRVNVVDGISLKDCINQPFSYRPGMLTVDIRRQRFDTTSRSWTKLTDLVKIDDSITIGGNGGAKEQRYTLYAIVTHRGGLQSGLHTPYVRPGGLGGQWYAYKDGRVICLTRKQAIEWHEGVSKSRKPQNSFEGRGTEDECACVAMYVRDDVTADVFKLPTEEAVPSWTRSWGKKRLPSSTSQISSDIPPQKDHTEVGLPVPNPYRSAAQALDEDATPGSLDTQPVVNTAVDRDGDDTIMSDAGMESEEGSQQGQRHIESEDMIDSKSTLTKIASRDHGLEPLTIARPSEIEERTQQLTIDFFSREYYSGTALLGDGQVFHGNGYLITTGGDVYSGAFSHGDYHGQGSIEYSNGDRYVGAWEHGKRHGDGTFTEAATGNIHKGNWEDGERVGEGVTYWKKTVAETKTCQICYGGPLDTAIYDCGHVVSCSACARNMDLCPVCRRRVIATLKLYPIA